MDNNISTPNIAERAEQLSTTLLDENNRKIDRLFAGLMVFQWFAGIATVFLVSPYTWIGDRELIHVHLWAAIIVGGLISAAPIWLVLGYPGQPLTRHVIAVAQAMWGALLIHLSGGRLETHFHIFGSLAFIAFYRDWKVIITMTVVVAVDHAVRGIFFPISVYGIILESPYRWIEHTAWVLFEDIVLLQFCRRSTQEIRAVCEARAELENANHLVEQKIEARTSELRQASERLSQMSLIAKYTDNAVIIMNPDGRVQMVNEGFERLYGYSEAEVKGRRPHDLLLGAESNRETASYMESRLAEGHGYDVELCKYRKSGEPIWVSIEVRPIRSFDGQVTSFVSMAKDITERRKQEQRLQLLREAIDNANDAMFIVQEDGAFVDVNATASERLGYSREQLLKLSLPEIEHSLKLHSWQERWEAVQCGGVAELSGSYRAKDGSTFPVEVSAFPVNYLGQSYFCAFARDTTEREQAEQERARLSIELQNAARQAGMAELAADILHNIGNALNSINVSIQALQNGVNSTSVDVLQRATIAIRDQKDELAAFLSDDPRGRMFPTLLLQLGDRLGNERERQRKELHDLRDKIEHVKEVVASQRAFSKRRAMSESVAPNELFESAISMNSYMSSNRAVTIERRFVEIEDVYMEKHLVMQVLINLIKNAREAMLEHAIQEPKIVVSTRTDGQFVYFEVKDNGIGIPEHQLVEVFQHGFTTKKTGSGFGLHSCANLVQEMGGSLTVHSSGVGFGATFTVRLPMNRTPAAKSVEA